MKFHLPMLFLMPLMLVHLSARYNIFRFYLCYISIIYRLYIDYPFPSLIIFYLFFSLFFSPKNKQKLKLYKFLSGISKLLCKFVLILIYDNLFYSFFQPHLIYFFSLFFFFFFSSDFETTKLYFGDNDVICSRICSCSCVYELKCLITTNNNNNNKNNNNNSHNNSNNNNNNRIMMTKKQETKEKVFFF